MELRICLLLLPLLLSATVSAHNITHILAKHPEFSTFSHYLTITHLASEINRRLTITVCAVDNAAMGDLISKHYPIEIVKNILSLHIFADYFGAKKLHEITHGSTTTSSIFQATGEAAGTSGYVNITDMKGGKVGFTPVDTDSDHPMATYVKSLEEQPYKIAVIQISHVLTSPEAEAPVGSPSDINVTALMAKQGCLSFSNMITAQGQDDMFATSLQGGLTIFCPSDDALKSFMPKYKNLTSDAKNSLLLYHGLPVYYSLGMLRSSNGLMNTLATEGSRKKYDFNVKNDGDDVKLETKVVTALVKGTLIDEEPLAVYKIDKVLQPTELFKAEVAAAPKLSRTRHAAGGAGGDDDNDADAPSEEDDAVADATASGVGRICGASFGLLVGFLMWSF